ncbi:MAG: hypothetical protein CMM84_16305 [Rhodothermaceae bacterium]|nr:hypothetical protein [Rhodothermaceae bacterium]MAQ95078.1 hypothetical protein [Rhodothermaceae bacterium]MBC12492.1 hypothetical protein [Rhodothermaceae bacterium]
MPAPIETIREELVKLQDEIEAVSRAYHLALTDLSSGRMGDEKRVSLALAHLQKEVLTLDSVQARAERASEAARQRLNEVRAFRSN